MYRTFGAPTFFGALSAADNRWPSLRETIQLLLFHTPCDAENPEAPYSRQKAVCFNPHIVSAFFARRQEALFAAIYGENVEDFWGIYEWQNRGSVHLHYLIWLRDAPAIAPLGPILRVAKHRRTAKSRMLPLRTSFVFGRRRVRAPARRFA